MRRRAVEHCYFVGFTPDGRASGCWAGHVLKPFLSLCHPLIVKTEEDFIFRCVAKNWWANRTQEALNSGGCLLWEGLVSQCLKIVTGIQTSVFMLGTTTERKFLVLLIPSLCYCHKCFCSSAVNWIVEVLWIRTVQMLHCLEVRAYCATHWDLLSFLPYPRVTFSLM